MLAFGAVTDEPPPAGFIVSSHPWVVVVNISQSFLNKTNSMHGMNMRVNDVKLTILNIPLNDYVRNMQDNKYRKYL